MALLEDEVSTLEDAAFYFSDSKDVRECVCVCVCVCVYVCVGVYVCACVRTTV